MNERSDWAVILARGASRRMGKPKGMCRLGGSGPTLLEAVAALYRRAGIPQAVVTTPELAALYRPLLPEAGVVWIERPSGGGTAASVIAALEDLADRATHLWLHPVDLPEVAGRTLASLARLSRKHPRAALVPLYRGTPGHPVVLPVAEWLDLRGRSVEGSMRDLLSGPARGGRVVADLDDPGVTADLDTPDDLGEGAGAGDEPGDTGENAT